MHVAFRVLPAACSQQRAARPASLAPKQVATPSCGTTLWNTLPASRTTAAQRWAHFEETILDLCGRGWRCHQGGATRRALPQQLRGGRYELMQTPPGSCVAAAEQAAPGAGAACAVGTLASLWGCQVPDSLLPGLPRAARCKRAGRPPGTSPANAARHVSPRCLTPRRPPPPRCASCWRASRRAAFCRRWWCCRCWPRTQPSGCPWSRITSPASCRPTTGGRGELGCLPPAGCASALPAWVWCALAGWRMPACSACLGSAIQACLMRACGPRRAGGATHWLGVLWDPVPSRSPATCPCVLQEHSG